MNNHNMITPIEIPFSLSKRESAIIIDALSRLIHDIEMKNYYGNPYGYGDKAEKYKEEVKEIYYYIFKSSQIGQTLDDVMRYLVNEEDDESEN